jgi:hypothetical protein
MQCRFRGQGTPRRVQLGIRLQLENEIAVVLSDLHNVVADCNLSKDITSYGYLSVHIIGDAPHLAPCRDVLRLRAVDVDWSSYGIDVGAYRAGMVNVHRKSVRRDAETSTLDTGESHLGRCKPVRPGQSQDSRHMPGRTVGAVETGVTGVRAQALRPVGNARSVVDAQETVTKLSGHDGPSERRL